jgi:hypothetical protein
MTYITFPTNTVLSKDEFIFEMNKAIASLDEKDVKDIKVCADDSGYWLEHNGVISSDFPMLLSLSRDMVLGKSKV